MHLWPKRVKGIRRGTKGTEIIPEELDRDNINMDTLFEEFLRLKNFSCGEGVIFDDVPSWIMARKQAYVTFREKLGRDKLVDWDKLHNDYRDFLYFKHNYSWTTLYRTGLRPLSNLKKLWKLLTFIQDETISVNRRVREGLAGKYHCAGLGRNILTALLHTFHSNTYGVWNNRTEHTLTLIHRKPRPTTDPGYNYQRINNELNQLTKELNTDLTTIDSLMWYISKKKPIIK